MSSPFNGIQLLDNFWDSKDVDAFVGAFAEDAIWMVNTAPPATGTEAIRGLTQALMASSKSSRHYNLTSMTADATDTEGIAKKVIVHGNVEYETENSEEKIQCAFCDIFLLNDEDKIAKCYTYMDTTPLLPSPSES